MEVRETLIQITSKHTWHLFHSYLSSCSLLIHIQITLKCMSPSDIKHLDVALRKTPREKHLTSQTCRARERALTVSVAGLPRTVHEAASEDSFPFGAPRGHVSHRPTQLMRCNRILM